jgi:hypothetical protein
MTLIQIKSRVNPDGTVVVPVGAAEAGKEVLVTVEPALAPMTQDEWVAAVRQTAGSITDPTFTAPPDVPPRPAPDLDR